MSQDMSPEQAQAKAAEFYAKCKSPGVPDLSCETVVLELQREGDSAVLPVDVRTQEEQEVSMLPGAIPSRQLDSMLHSEDKDTASRLRHKKLACYCTSGHCSGQYAKKLREQHGLDAYDLEGSILGWTHTPGARLVDSRMQPTRRVHTYAPQFAAQARGYEAVSFSTQGAFFRYSCVLIRLHLCYIVTSNLWCSSMCVLSSHCLQGSQGHLCNHVA
jgi:rhodanese-related sulfurtransferase